MRRDDPGAVGDARWAAAIDASDGALLLLRGDGRIVEATAGAARLLGLPADGGAGLRLVDHLGEAPADGSDAPTRRHLASPLDEAAHTGEALVRRPGCRPVWVSVVGNRIAGEAHAIVVLTDVTLAKTRERLQRRALESMVRDEPLADVMAGICRELESIAPEVVASILEVDDELRLHPLAAPSMPEAVAAALDGLACGPTVGSCGTAAWRREAVLVRDIATDPLWAAYRGLVLPLGLAACWSTPILAGDGRALGTFAFYFREPRGPDAFHHRLVEISVHLCALALEKARTSARLHRLVSTDLLTGLPNRASLQRAVLPSPAGAARTAALVIGIDRFKLINDIHGRQTGDRLLAEVGRRLRLEARGGDEIARLSGDEFGVLLHHCDAEQAQQAALRMLAAIERPMLLGEASVKPGATIGIALAPAEGAEVDALLAQAEVAMHQAKRGARGRARFYCAGMNEEDKERLALEIAFRGALQRGDLQLHYQPQLRGEGDRLHGVEALLRWHDPAFGDVSPARFVPLAEEAGLSLELGAWVLEAACRQMVQWRRDGRAVPRVAINLSALDFRDAGLPARIGEALRRHGLAPSDLVVELTETVMLDTSPEVLATIDAVHALGIGLALDDFGTGYSSLAHLHRLPIGEIKLDRSFVRDLGESECARRLASIVLDIGRRMRLDVVAEGVETEAQRGLLAAAGCDVFQGYLFGRPMAAAAFEAWLCASSERGQAPAACAATQAA